jgi:hypothetical protein
MHKNIVYVELLPNPLGRHAYWTTNTRSFSIEGGMSGMGALATPGMAAR